MTPTKKPDAEKRNAEREAALTFVRMAKEKGLDLTGPDGLLKQFTKSVLETALDEEMTEHLGRAKHKKSKDGRAANTRNGTTAKTVVTDSVVRSGSRCRETAMARSSRSSSGNGSGGCPGWTRWCCPCMPGA